MSVLHFLPRLSSWSNLYSRGERNHEDYSQNEPDDLLLLREKINNQREIVPPLSKGSNRRKISYWSDNEVDSKYRRDLQRFWDILSKLLWHIHNLVLSFRYSEYEHGQLKQTRHKREFVTSWRPQTTFGYKDDFDLERHKLKIRKRVSYLHPGHNPRQFYRYHSSPQILIRFEANSKLEHFIFSLT